MTLRVLTAIAALLLGASAATAQGLSPCPPIHSTLSAFIVQAPHGAASEPFSSMLIAEAITLAPSSTSTAPLPAPAARAEPSSYVGPGLTLVTPTPSRDVDSPSSVPDAHAAIDAGPTFVPPTSTFVLHRPSYEAPAR
jgi:hypothetical protein